MAGIATVTSATTATTHTLTNMKKIVAATTVTNLAMSPVSTEKSVMPVEKSTNRTKRRTLMAMINSKKVKHILDQFVKEHGRGPTLKELLSLMQGRKP